MRLCDTCLFLFLSNLFTTHTRENSTDGQREDHEDDIISMVRISFVDDETNVCSAVAKAFDILQKHIGVKAIDQTLPTILEALCQPGKGSGTALQALQEVNESETYIKTNSYLTIIIILICECILASPGNHRLPRVNTDINCDTHGPFQCSGTRVSCYCCGECSEQEVDC